MDQLVLLSNLPCSTQRVVSGLWLQEEVPPWYIPTLLLHMASRTNSPTMVNTLVLPQKAKPTNTPRPFVCNLMRAVGP